jgi:hypothetical protein
VYRKLALFAAAVSVVAALALPASSAGSRSLQVGIYDDGYIVGNPAKSFPLLKQLRTQVIRVTLHWGGRGSASVARRKPERATDPADSAYSWGHYDDIVRRATENKIKVMFTIVGTPSWANGGKRWNRAPKNASTLRAFAYAAATRYSGSFTPDGADTPLPAVRFWLAWNEPNDPVFLWPQYRKVGKKRYVVQSARDYARICNAVVAGVHASLLRGERIGCGVTSPRGNNRAGGKRPSVSPLVFLFAMRRAGARGFDAYAHHPYYGRPSESPTKAPAKTAVTLANIGTLTRAVTRAWGPKRIWITEYGYQTRPPDPFFGVTWKRQANYLSQAYSIARKNPRIDMMIWFLLRDEPRVRGKDGWQSGLITRAGRKKPAWTAFRRLRR